MLANDVQETTITDGSGDVTLDGSSDNGKTFTSQFANNVRFLYRMDNRAGDWESGIGYLSSSNTLVKESPLDGSAFPLPVTFPAGTSQVYVATSAKANQFSIKTNASGTDQQNGWNLSPHFNGISLADKNDINPNRVYLIPHVHQGGRVSDMSTRFAGSIGAATKFRLGIYTMEQDGVPGSLLAQTGDMTPLSNTIVTASLLSSIHLNPGWYCFAYLDDGGARLRALNSSNAGISPFGIRGDGPGDIITFLSDPISSGWTVLPATVSPNTLGRNTTIPGVLYR